MNIIKGLRNKLALLDYDATYDLLDVPIPPTVWIVGLPRTGSTYFHSLLSLDDDHVQTYKQWELRAPVPHRPAWAAQEETNNTNSTDSTDSTDITNSTDNTDSTSNTTNAALAGDARQQQAEKAEWLFQLIFHPLTNIHYVASNQVDECVQGFVEATINEYYLWGCHSMPKAWDWYVNQTAAITQYEHFKRSIAVPFTPSSLRNNPHKKKISAIVLKSPHHSVKLRTIAKVFNAPVYIWLHRDVESVVGSTCSMNVAINDCICATFERKEQIGRRTLETLAKAMDKAVKDRAALEKEGKVVFVDIFHEDLRSNPLDVVRRVYSVLQMKVSTQFQEQIAKDTKQRREERKRTNNSGRSRDSSNSRSQHRYNLEEFGLTSVAVKNAFTKYSAMVNRIRNKRDTATNLDDKRQ
jgi:LPS sulfotransferase NodH